MVKNLGSNFQDEPRRFLPYHLQTRRKYITEKKLSEEGRGREGEGGGREGYW
jgi:hypothetical protein